MAAQGAAGLSRLTGRRADKLRANELQAEARWPRLVIVRLPLQLQMQLQLSYPHLHARRLVSPSQRRGACRASRNKTCSLCVFSCLANLQLHDTLCLRL